jgi:signal transduction histidine kinase
MKRLFSTDLVSIFRTFMIIRLVWALLTLLSVFNRPKFLPFPWAQVVGVAECLLVLVYLFMPGLEKRLGRWYLPLGLVAATLGPSLENLIFLWPLPLAVATAHSVDPAFLDELRRMILLAAQVELIFILFVPLILTSWQYSYRIVIYFCLFLAALDVIIAALIGSAFNNQMFAFWAATLFRTLLFLFIGYVINRLVSGQKEQTERLAQANRHLTNYAATLEQLATSRERNRLAREIHDTLAHTLSGLAVNLEAVGSLWDVNPQQAHKILDQSLAVTRSGLVETRRAIQALRASPLEDLGLRLALENLAQSAAARYGLKLDLHLAMDLMDLDPEMEHCIYRIAEEGLRNVGEHAHASRIRMSMEHSDDNLIFQLSDDGRGFNLPSGLQDEKFGIQGMQERAESIGAELMISSQSGQGAQLKLVVKERGI